MSLWGCRGRANTGNQYGMVDGQQPPFDLMLRRHALSFSKAGSQSQSRWRRTTLRGGVIQVRMVLEGTVGVEAV